MNFVSCPRNPRPRNPCLWKAAQAARAQELEELRRLWREGVESGPAEDGPTAFARLRRRYAATGSE